MQLISMIWGIFSILGMLIGFLPCVGALNWIVIPFASLGVLVCGVTLATSRDPYRGGAIAGLVCCFVAVIVGAVRLFLGGGIL